MFRNLAPPNPVVDGVLENVVFKGITEGEKTAAFL